MATIQGELLDAVVSYLQTNETGFLSLLKAQNTNVATFVENAAITLVSKVPIIGSIIAQAITGAGPQLVAFLGTEEQAAYAAVLALLQSEAKTLGG